LARLELLASGGRGADDDCIHRLHGLGTSLDRGVARTFDLADHLDGARPGLRQRVGLPAQYGAGGTLGVEPVALALQTPQLAVGAIDLENRNRSPRPLPVRYDQVDCKPEAP
jgi:hypothetical protein